ncbi:hypothetical protein EYF80_026247 [Liparis tanakae]|uniref:Uncharacterized protein n=1 Tax=Liparis tanakae TaxID=230148 RepID=A0A4Z2HE10_9TELE|nr:hypothetical protein EYF80_026247 [Liparis tanakae]
MVITMARRSEHPDIEHTDSLTRVPTCVFCYDTEEMGLWGDPICVRTLSSHCRGPCRCTSIQQGVLTTSKPWFTDWERSWANSWLLKILRLQPLGILHTVVVWKPCWKLQLRLWTKMLLSLRHSAYTSPPT